MFFYYGLFFLQVFGGFLMNIEDIAVWLQWLQYFSIFRYGLNVREVLTISILTFYVKIK